MSTENKALNDAAKGYELNVDQWLIKEGYPEVMTMTRDNLAIVINSFIKNQSKAQQGVSAGVTLTEIQGSLSFPSWQ